MKKRNVMATDDDRPRTSDEELTEGGLEELRTRRRSQEQTGAVDVDEADLAESRELAGADLSGEVLIVWALPRQADEFTATRCFLVHHRSQLVSSSGGTPEVSLPVVSCC
jgi:hypothetical protein